MQAGKSIIIENISKHYGSVKALENINFSVDNGEMFGLIGPDGAGKTSLIRILTSLLLPTSGNAIVNGYDIVKDYKKIRKTIGYMPGKFSLYYDLTVEENLNFFATVFGTTIKENYDLIKDIYSQIEPFKDRQAGKLSGGMKQKLALSCAMIHKPDVLFLDEPTTGVDAVSRKEFWLMLKKIKNKGITIFVSTPYMDEAELCDRVALIQDGTILTVDTPVNVVKSFDNPLYSIYSDNIYYLLKDLRALSATKSVFAFGQSVHITFNNGTNIEDVNKYLKDTGHSNSNTKIITPCIEDCFMQLMSVKS